MAGIPWIDREGVAGGLDSLSLTLRPVGPFRNEKARSGRGRAAERLFQAEAAARLQQIPGVGERAAELIMGEIGPDMESFPTAGHLCSWAGLCPGNDQSAGKRRSGKTTKGSPWLRSLLVQSAWSASHTKNTVFSICYRRWVPRLGKKKALIAVAHKILMVIWHLLKEGTSYRERQQPLPAP